MDKFWENSESNSARSHFLAFVELNGFIQMLKPFVWLIEGSSTGSREISHQMQSFLFPQDVISNKENKNKK